MDKIDKMEPYKEVAVSDGSRIKILASNQDEYRIFIRLSPTLVLGHIILLGTGYLHLYKENGGPYFFHGSVYFTERSDGAVLWNMDLACDGSPEQSTEARNTATKAGEFANQTPGAGIFLQLMSASTLPRIAMKVADERLPATVPTRKPNR